MFDNVIGHENIKKELESQLNNGCVFHAYIFYGTSGIGKKLLAEEFAKQILKVNNLECCPDYKYICKSIRKNRNIS
jgi:DNA polymerase-3 subunit delta'